ncbi:MAG: methyl-accepting chemotaxis protein [Prevotella sp.]|nr:methyl-accepting chemotaxis protein [Prevotella sp.]
MPTLPKIITRTLSLKLSLMAVCEISLLLMVALAVMFHYSRKVLKEEAMIDAEHTLDGTAQHIDNVLLSVEQSAGNIYFDLLKHLDEPERMYDYSRHLVESNPYIVGCAIVFKPHYYPGKELFMAYVRRKGYSLTADNTELVTQATYTERPYTEQEWYTKPMKREAPCWTYPLKNEDAEGEPLVSFCLPIRDKSDTCVGVLAADLPISLLSQIVLSAKPSPHGYSTLLAENGSFIVHPDSTKLTYQTVFYQLHQGADPTFIEAAEAMVAGEKGFRSIKIDGKKWYAFFKPFERSVTPGRAEGQLGWSVGVVYPDDDIFEEYNRLLYYLLTIAIVGLLVFFLLVRFVTHRQLLPLSLLTHSAQRIAKGKYSETIPATNRKDEIGQLQEHFQQMQQSLASHISELEQLSTTLKDRNEVLRIAYDRAQEADMMKIAFLHHMTNQMLEPTLALENSVKTLCNNYQELTQQEADHEVDNIQQKSHTIIEVLNSMIHGAEDEIQASGVQEGSGKGGRL